MKFKLIFSLRSFERNNRPEVFCKKGVLGNFAKFTGKHLCQSLFFNKRFLQKETLAQLFSCEFCEISKKCFLLTEHLLWLLLTKRLLSSFKQKERAEQTGRLANFGQNNKRGGCNKRRGWQKSPKLINGEGATNGEAGKNTAIRNFIGIKSSSELVKISTKKT